MDPLKELLDWATARGVKLNGIAPERMPGRGIGITATRDIKPEEVILEVPASCLRNVDTVPKPIARKLPAKMSIHGLLAADLALDRSDTYSVWNAVCPAPQDFSTVPLCWPEELQARLPHAARELLRKQQAKLDRDWGAVVAAGFARQGEAQEAEGAETKGGLEFTEYRHAWLLVNTRTFYFVNARLKKRSKDDHMALQPVADLFNHADEGCNVSFDHEGFAVKALRAYGAGDEVHICYGRHSGDFLLVEYGFAMDANRWDEVSLDEFVLGRLGERQRQRLEEAGFLGNYVLDRDAVCYRTQVAVRLLCCKLGEWRLFVDGADDGEASQPLVDRLLLEMLEEYLQKAEDTIRTIERMEEGLPEQRGVLIKRLNQIGELLQAQIDRLSESKG